MALKSCYTEGAEYAETDETISYCFVAVIKLMEITRVGARRVKEKCREQGKCVRGYIFYAHIKFRDIIET